MTKTKTKQRGDLSAAAIHDLSADYVAFELDCVGTVRLGQWKLEEKTSGGAGTFYEVFHCGVMLHTKRDKAEACALFLRHAAGMEGFQERIRRRVLDVLDECAKDYGMADGWKDAELPSFFPGLDAQAHNIAKRNGWEVEQ